MADAVADTGGGFIAPELRIERERSKLVLEELMDVVLGKEYMQMKHEMGTYAAEGALAFVKQNNLSAIMLAYGEI